MKRRQLLGLVPGAALLGALPALAQNRPAVVGWLHMSSRDLDAGQLAVFKEGLAALGWKEGSQYVVSEHWADGRVGRLPAMVAELAKRKPQVTVSWATQPMAPALKAMPAVPIVQVASADPVITGFAKSLARPGGMVTGLSNAVTDTAEKMLELLLAAAPGRRRVGFLMDSTNFARLKFLEQAKRSVAALDVEARFAEVGTPEEIEPAMASLAAQAVDGLIVLASPLLATERRRIVRSALEHRWPVAAPRHEYVEEGALLAYGIDVMPQFRRAAYYVDRILKGAKPGDLPIEQPTRVELVVSMRTAKRLKIAVPASLLARADRVVE